MVIDLVLIGKIAKWLVAVAGGIAVVVAIVKKILTPILNPIKELAEKQEHIEECLNRDKKRLDKHDEILGLLVKDNEMELTSLMQLINHLRTDNNTGSMKVIEDSIDKYLISRK